MNTTIKSILVTLLIAIGFGAGAFTVQILNTDTQINILRSSIYIIGTIAAASFVSHLLLRLERKRVTSSFSINEIKDIIISIKKYLESNGQDLIDLKTKEKVNKLLKIIGVSLSSFYSYRLAAMLIGAALSMALVTTSLMQTGMLKEGNKLVEDASVTSVILDLGTYWDSNLDIHSRDRFKRFMDALKLVGNESEKKNAIDILVNRNNLRNKDNILKNSILNSIVKSYPDNNDKEQQLMIEIESSIIRLLNTFEVVVTTRDIASSPRAKAKIDDSYRDFITSTYLKLEPFIKSQLEANDEKEAWEPLRKMIKEGEWSKK